MAYTGPDFLDLIIWKQTSKAMVGPYPNPGIHLINNTTEHIFVYRKPGKARSIPRDVKEASTIPIQIHRDLTQRVWWMYPQDVKRAQGHRAAFPEKLPGRLIELYTFIGDVVRDPLLRNRNHLCSCQDHGSPLARDRHYPAFLEPAAERIEAAIDPRILEVGHLRWPRVPPTEASIAI